MKKIISLIILALLVSSCENLNEPINSEIVSVNCILNAEKEEQDLYLYRTVNINENLDENNYNEYFVKNAEISLHSDGNLLCKFYEYTKTTLNPDYGESFEPKYLPFSYKTKAKLVGSKKYSIKVKTKELNIEGTTLLPGDFNLNISSKEFMKVKELENLTIKWTESKGAAGYIVNSYSAYKDEWLPEGYKYFPKKLKIKGIFTKNREWNYKLSVASNVDSLLVCVIAVDSNFVNYKFTEGADTSLKNASGLFASSVTKKSVIVIKR